MSVQKIIPLPIRRSLGGAWSSWNRTARKSLLKWSLRGHAVECNVCGWRGGKFADDLWHAESICPECGSQVRHRLLVATLNGLSPHPGLTESAFLQGKDILHFAPERQLRQRVQKAAQRYVTADFDRGDTDWRLDISAMPSVKDAEFDVVICCDVLEHVPNDRAAFLEIHRVLRPGGAAILTVPQKDSPASTDEDASVTSETERERRFGQKDHVRMYGDDFADRVTVEGFQVTQVRESSFEKTVQDRFVLYPPTPSPHPLATNQRIIYFCQR